MQVLTHPQHAHRVPRQATTAATNNILDKYPSKRLQLNTQSWRTSQQLHKVRITKG